MDPNLAAVGWLWGTEPTDRALAGWQPRTWLALGGGMVMPHKEMRDVLRYAPCRYGMAWREAVSASLPGPPEPTGTPGR